MESLRVDRWLSWLKIQKDVQLVAKEAGATWPEPDGRSLADRLISMKYLKGTELPKLIEELICLSIFVRAC